jgi:hypothetical protein
MKLMMFLVARTAAVVVAVVAVMVVGKEVGLGNSHAPHCDTSSMGGQASSCTWRARLVVGWYTLIFLSRIL